MARERVENPFVFVDALSMARSGAPQGFDKLYFRFSGEVQLLGVFECFSQPGVLVDSVLARAFADVADFVGSEPNFAGYLFSLAMDQVIAERQQHGLRVDEHFRCSHTNFDHEIDSASLLRMHDAVHWLTGVQRQVLHLRLTFGLNLLQVARVLDLAIPEVRRHQMSIEQTLVSNLPESPPMPGPSFASPLPQAEPIFR